MTIALDATYSLGDALSGVGVYSREILRGLARNHPECRLLYCYRPHRFLRALRTPVPGNAHRRIFDDQWVPRADLFHGLNQRLPRRPPRRAITTFHDLFVLTGEYSTPEFRRRFAEQARHAAANSQLILAVSAFTARQVQELLGVEPARLRVVHHGVYPAAPRTVAREKTILSVGALQTRKNIIRLVEAFEQVDAGWRLVLAGSQGYGAEKILARIENSPARARIELPGWVTPESLADWYARASVFAFPSLDEGFGMPVLEAMAAGVPVITSNRSALPEVAGDAALLVDPEDTAALAKGLRDLSTDQELRLELVRRGRRRAADFSWTRAAELTWEAYQDLAR